ncbi:MAG: DUF6049 family protein [Actinomycetota bacterium]
MRKAASTITALAAGLAWLVPAAASAQQSSSAAGKLKASLTDFPAFLGPQDTLRIGLSLSNSSSKPAKELQVSLFIHDRIRSRSHLNNTIDGRLGAVLGSDTFDVEGEVEARGRRTITVEKPLSEISAMRSADDRAYPVRIVVRTERTSADAIVTHMVFFNAPVLQPLGVALVVPIHSPPLYTSARRPDSVGSASREKALTSGRVRTIIDALDRRPELPVTIAPSGLLIDMLADLSGGFLRTKGSRVVGVKREDPAAKQAESTLARLKLLASRPQKRVLPMPYSDTSLTTLVRASLEDRAQAQVSESRTRLGKDPGGVLGASPLPGWLLTGGSALDERTFSELQRSGVDRVVVSPKSLRESPKHLTEAAPVRLATRTGPLLAVVEDTGLADKLKRSPGQNAIVARQNFLADTATIMLERPALKRGVVAVAPIDWSPSRSQIEGILAALESNPWMRPMTIDQMADQLAPPVGGRPAPLQSVLEDEPEAPPAEYFSSIRTGLRAIARYADLGPPPDRLRLLQNRLLIAESSFWWKDRARRAVGRGFAASVLPTVEAEMKRVRAPGPQTITLTSRTGVIPLSVNSTLGYPVDVVLRLDSDKLKFPQGNLIHIDKLQPPNQTIEVRTVAQATGTFPLRVRIQTPTGITISDARLTIRSTAYNVVAVAITGGAALFLVGWWSAGAISRRLHK